jgi:asparagine synthase (glutamine-hydrolysing)
MCGIAGIITTSYSAESYYECIQAMTDAMSHRGPDDAGTEIISRSDPSVLFGHRRLAIIDLSVAGHQPMRDPETNNWITFNGEIYNYRELHHKLEKQGEVFRTQTDTEVILKAYAVWGNSCVNYLRGIFAFGLWDNHRQVLFLARDQLGVKPLYYWQDKTTLLFASEVRSLLASGLVKRQMHLQGMRSYLAYGSVQEPYTLVKNVCSLPAGHTMNWHCSKIEIQRYWRLPSPDCVLDEAPTNVFDEVRHHIYEAVQLQLVADVPLGAFLSGGIDSTAIAALMKQIAGDVVKTFSVVFNEKLYDERHYAQLASQHIGTQHTELLLSGEEVRQSLQAALVAFDQPSTDGLNTYFVSKATREAGLTVALSGVGGDELFGGYNGYQKPLLLERWGTRLQYLPIQLRSFFFKLFTHLPRGEIFRKVGDLLVFPHHPYFLSRQMFGLRQVADLLSPDVMPSTQDWELEMFAKLEQSIAGYDAINRASALELQTYMLSTLLRDTDQMSMAHALEVRVPLIDHKLVEYIFKLPGTCKVSSRQPKPLLTQSLENLLPQQCVYRQKRGFELPFAVWLRESLYEEMRASFVDQHEEKAMPFSPSGLAQLWRQFERGQVGWSRVWGVFVFRWWIEKQGILCA